MKQPLVVSPQVHERQEIGDFRRTVALAVLEGFRANLEARKTTTVTSGPKRWWQRREQPRVWDTALDALARAS